MRCSSPLDFGSLTKHPGERLALEFDFFENLARFWEAGEFYRAGDVRRPTRANGFAYRARNDGTSDSREPRWLKSGNTHDGSLSWEAIPANHEGVDIIVSAQCAVTPKLTLVQAPTWDGAEATCVIEGGEHGEKHTATCSVATQSGQILVGVLTVNVSERKRC